MIPRNTKSRPTNRQRQEAAADDTPEWMAKPRYPKMHILPEWMERISQMPRDEGNALLYAAAGYGIREIEPTTEGNLTPEALEYFNREIRPELDRQHKRLNEGNPI